MGQLIQLLISQNFITCNTDDIMNRVEIENLQRIPAQPWPCANRGLKVATRQSSMEPAFDLFLPSGAKDVDMETPEHFTTRSEEVQSPKLPELRPLEAADLVHSRWGGIAHNPHSKNGR
eukprot:1825369-Amphidinium_carterae.1